jgi:hypothetical protein
MSTDESSPIISNFSNLRACAQDVTDYIRGLVLVHDHRPAPEDILKEKYIIDKKGGVPMFETLDDLVYICSGKGLPIDAAPESQFITLHDLISWLDDYIGSHPSDGPVA